MVFPMPESILIMIVTFRRYMLIDFLCVKTKKSVCLTMIKQQKAIITPTKKKDDEYGEG